MCLLNKKQKQKGLLMSMILGLALGTLLALATSSCTSGGSGWLSTTEAALESTLNAALPIVATYGVAAATTYVDAKVEDGTLSQSQADAIMVALTQVAGSLTSKDITSHVPITNAVREHALEIALEAYRRSEND